MLEFLLVVFIVLSAGLLISLRRSKKALLNLSKEHKYERKVSQQKIHDLRNIVSNTEELNAKYLKDISTLHTQVSDLKSESTKQKTQAKSKTTRKPARKNNSNQQK